MVFLLLKETINLPDLLYYGRIRTRTKVNEEEKEIWKKMGGVNLSGLLMNVSLCILYYR